MHARGFAAIIAVVLGASIASAQREELSELRPDDCTGVGGFGFGVALEGTLALVGGYGDSVNPQGVWLYDVGDPANPALLRVLTSSNGAAGDLFGTSLALRAGLAVVGAVWHSEGAGSVYLFDSASGVQLSKIAAPDADAGDSFGAVSVSGDLLLVGAAGDDENGTDAGAAYVFDISDPTSPVMLAKILGGGAGDGFGGRAVVRGGLAAIAALRDNTNTGSVSIFDLADPTHPSLLATFSGSDSAPQEYFGYSLALSGDTLLVGTPYAERDGGNSGAAYVFDISDPASPVQLAKLAPASSDYFGSSIAIDGAAALIGSLGDNNGAGAAYLFDTETGGQLLKLQASNGGVGEQLGTAVALSGQLALAGAPEHFGGCWGAAYLFDAEPCATDINRDGLHDSRDILAFLNLWASGDPQADWNADGAIDSADVLAFLNAWGAPCP